MNEKILEQRAEDFMKDKDFDLPEGYSLAFIETALVEFAEQETKNLEELNTHLNNTCKELAHQANELQKDKENLIDENKELKELVEKYRQATDRILHITFMGGGCEVQTIGQYATLVDGYLTDVEGLAKWKN